METKSPLYSQELLHRYAPGQVSQHAFLRQVLLTFCVFALMACGDQRTLDGSSPEAFARSVPVVARTVPETERSEFTANLTTVAQANGSISLDEPSISTLVTLDGGTPERVRELAAQVRQAQERQRVEHLVAVAEREVEALAKRLDFAKEQLDAANVAEKRLSAVTVSEVSTAAVGQGRTELRFQVRNGNATPVEVRGITLDVHHASGLAESIGPLTMLGLSEGCLYGQRLGPRSEAAVVCSLRETHNPSTKYKLRVVEVHIPGEAPRIGELESTAAKRQRAEGLSSELSAKQAEVDALRKRLELEK